MDGTDDDIILEDEAANDGDSDVDSDEDLLHPDLNKELCAIFDEESIDEDFVRFSWKASSNPNGPFQHHKSTINMYDTSMNPFY